MKRVLRVVDGAGQDPLTHAVVVRVGERVVSIYDGGTGASARRFADALVALGGRIVDAAGAPPPELRIAIRSAGESFQDRAHARSLEASVDIVLGSVRPEFARHFVKACNRAADRR